jgi:hypothetical protein
MSFRPMSLLLITASIDYLVTVDRAARIIRNGAIVI